jgi:hypothetical protein
MPINTDERNRRIRITGMIGALVFVKIFGLPGLGVLVFIAIIGLVFLWEKRQYDRADKK